MDKLNFQEVLFSCTFQKIFFKISARHTEQLH
jgi:hypothetical protein